MPLYMDTHKNMDGLTAEAVVGAHQKDLEVQGKHGVNYQSYWFNVDEGTVFCLVDAPAKRRPLPSTAKPTASWRMT